MADAALHRAMPSFPDGLAPAARGLTRLALAGFQAEAWDRHPVYASAVNTALYPPVFYAAAAVGLRVAQAAGAGPWQAMLVARLCNAAFYVLGGAAALLLARRAHALLAATLLLPMSLYLAGSLNQDGGMIAAAGLAAALLTRPGPGAAWAGAAVLALVVMAKPVYLPLAGLLLLAPLGWRTRAGAAALASVPGVIWFAVARAMAGVPFRVPVPYASGPLWPGPPAMFAVTDPALQAQVLLHQPALLLRLPAEAIVQHGAGRIRELVGVLGRLDLFLPVPLYAAWGLALTAAVLLQPREPRCRRDRAGGGTRSGPGRASPPRCSPSISANTWSGLGSGWRRSRAYRGATSSRCCPSWPSPCRGPACAAARPSAPRPAEWSWRQRRWAP